MGEAYNNVSDSVVSRQYKNGRRYLNKKIHGWFEASAREVESSNRRPNRVFQANDGLVCFLFTVSPQGWGFGGRCGFYLLDA